jgi:hypothetical protein
MSYFILKKDLHIDDALQYLGGLVVDVHRPSDSVFPENGCTVANDHLLTPVPLSASRLIHTSQNKTTVHFDLNRLFGIGGNSEHDRDLTLETNELITYGTKNQPELLMKVIKQDLAETWIQRTNGDVYMLVGFISAVDAIITTGTGSLTGMDAHTSIPISKVAGVAGNVRVGAEASHETQYQTSRHGTRSGEVVFAAEYRKVKRKRVIFRKMYALGDYPTGMMPLGYHDGPADCEDEEVEIEKYEYALEDITDAAGVNFE